MPYSYLNADFERFFQANTDMFDCHGSHFGTVSKQLRVQYCCLDGFSKGIWID